MALYVRVGPDRRRRERAVEFLRETISQSLARYAMEFHANPNLEPLWDYPPFQELLRPKG